MQERDQASRAGRSHRRNSESFRKDRPEDPIVLEEETEFCRLMRGFRERANRSRNSLAYQIGVDPSYLSRIEHGDREPPKPHIIHAFGRGLNLTLEEENRLLVSANCAPLTEVGRGGEPITWNGTHQIVEDVLNNGNLSSEVKESFRNVVETIGQMWLANGGEGGHSNDSNGHGEY